MCVNAQETQQYILNYLLQKSTGTKIKYQIRRMRGSGFKKKCNQGFKWMS